MKIIEYHIAYISLVKLFRLNIWTEYFSCESSFQVDLFLKKASEYDQEIPQSHTVDQPTASRGRATEH